VLRVKPVRVYVVRFGVLTVTDTSPVVKAVFVARWITKPVSFVALSVQVRTTEVLVTVPVARFVGAAGRSWLAVVIFTTLEYAELPIALNARTL